MCRLRIISEFGELRACRCVHRYDRYLRQRTRGSRVPGCEPGAGFFAAGRVDSSRVKGMSACILLPPGSACGGARGKERNGYAAGGERRRPWICCPVCRLRIISEFGELRACRCVHRYDRHLRQRTRGSRVPGCEPGAGFFAARSRSTGCQRARTRPSTARRWSPSVPGVSGSRSKPSRPHHPPLNCNPRVGRARPPSDSRRVWSLSCPYSTRNPRRSPRAGGSRGITFTTPHRTSAP